MLLFCCIARVQNAVKDDIKDENDIKCLVNLPSEILTKILSNLSTRDKIVMRYVSRRFREVGEMPLLWREFNWSFRPCHLRSVTNTLKEYGEHVRRLHLPDYVTPTRVLEMVHYCTKVTHLILPKYVQLSLGDVEEIIHTMTHLQLLDLFSDGQRPDRYPFMQGLLNITAKSIRELKLQVPYNPMHAINSIESCIIYGNPLPSNIDIFTMTTKKVTSQLFYIWLCYHSTPLQSFKLGLYEPYRITSMDLGHPIPLRKFRFGPVTTPPLIRLGTHGIVGLEHDVFHLNEYYHDGTVRHAIIPEHDLHHSFTKKGNFTYTSHLHTVSYVDVSNLNVHSNHLEQLAVVCPNLQRLNLQGNVNCLKDLRGLCVIVNTCQNLESLNLAGISVSSVESFLLLWELLSALKKLTYLGADLCMLKLCKSDDVIKQKIVTIFQSFHSLKTLEMQCEWSDWSAHYCSEC